MCVVYKSTALIFPILSRNCLAHCCTCCWVLLPPIDLIRIFFFKSFGVLLSSFPLFNCWHHFWAKHFNHSWIACSASVPFSSVPHFQFHTDAKPPWPLRSCDDYFCGTVLVLVLKTLIGRSSTGSALLFERFLSRSVRAINITFLCDCFFMHHRCDKLKAFPSHLLGNRVKSPS